jgi:hypothetical protein
MNVVILGVLATKFGALAASAAALFLLWTVALWIAWNAGLRAMVRRPAVLLQPLVGPRVGSILAGRASTRRLMIAPSRAPPGMILKQPLNHRPHQLRAPGPMFKAADFI